MEEIYQEYFIKRGQEESDIYLKAIGLWNLKKFVQAVNSLQMEENQGVVGEAKIFAGEEEDK